jgi:hypothetical protein
MTTCPVAAAVTLMQQLRDATVRRKMVNAGVLKAIVF